MKRYSFFLVLAILVVSFGLSFGAEDGAISATIPNGVWDDNGTDKIIVGPITYEITYDNTDGQVRTGMSFGFRLYIDGDDDRLADAGSSMIPMTGEVNPDYIWQFNDTCYPCGLFDELVVIYLSCDGLLADTMGFTYLKQTNITTGLPVDFNDIGVVLHGGVLNEGDRLCIDSSYYIPAGGFKWGPRDDMVNDFVTWNGPLCYVAKNPPCIAPNITNLPVGPIEQNKCVAFAETFTAEQDANDGSERSEIIWIDADLGDIDEFGNWTWGATMADVGTHTVTITVGNGGCQREETFTVTVQNSDPTIACKNTLKMTVGFNDFDIDGADADTCANLEYSVTEYTGTNDAENGAVMNGSVLTITEETAGTYSITIEVTDGAATASCTSEVIVELGSDYQVVIECVGDRVGPVFHGQTVDVDVELTTAVLDIGGYDMLIAYDNSALSFQVATMGAAYGGEYPWEYFKYRYGANGNCSNACPTGLLRVVAIAETNNGAVHPDYFGTGVLFTLRFLVTNDRNFECNSIPLRFYWTDCGDNTLSNKSGTELFLAESILDGYDPDSDSELQLKDIFNGSYGFPGFFGPHDDCVFTGKGDASSSVSFTSGCVFIACAKDIDDRGDLNLNNIPNEVADAVLYSRYFVYGLSVFDIRLQGQIAASDVNNDGIALSVADLVYLIRVVIGDALPYPKLAPTSTIVTDKDGVLSVRDAMGAAVVTISGSVVPELLVDNMKMIYNYDEASNTTRALVYNMTDMGATFTGRFISANGNVESIEVATYEGASVSAKILPGNYELSQNYPNPFNPGTSVGFAIPVASKVTLSIYNITGQRVAEFSGSYEAGNHVIEWDASNQASGIYFYKLNAGNFEETKKMVLLK